MMIFDPAKAAINLIRAAALGTLLCTSHAVAQSELISEAPVEMSDDVRRFCTNIADAARDRRYSLQAMELKKLQEDIDQRMQVLEEKRAEYEDWLKRREDFLAKAQDGVVAIYARMKPDAAAERLAELNAEVAAGILMKLETRQASVILNEMERKAAATVTTIMVAAARTQDPT